MKPKKPERDKNHQEPLMYIQYIYMIHHDTSIMNPNCTNRFFGHIIRSQPTAGRSGRGPWHQHLSWGVDPDTKVDSSSLETVAENVWLTGLRSAFHGYDHVEHMNGIYI